MTMLHPEQLAVFQMQLYVHHGSFHQDDVFASNLSILQRVLFRKNMQFANDLVNPQSHFAPAVLALYHKRL